MRFPHVYFYLCVFSSFCFCFSTHYPWPNDDHCKRYFVGFARNSSSPLPIVGLASYPSSGNTWLRYLIEGVTGYFSGSMYNDIMLNKKGEQIGDEKSSCRIKCARDNRLASLSFNPCIVTRLYYLIKKLPRETVICKMVLLVF